MEPFANEYDENKRLQRKLEKQLEERSFIMQCRKLNIFNREVLFFFSTKSVFTDNLTGKKTKNHKTKTRQKNQQ